MKLQAQTLGGDSVHAIPQEAEKYDQISITQRDDCYPNKVKGMCVCVCVFSHLPLFWTLQTIAYQVPPSMGFFQARTLEWVCHFLLWGLFLI